MVGKGSQTMLQSGGGPVSIEYQLGQNQMMVTERYGFGYIDHQQVFGSSATLGALGIENAYAQGLAASAYANYLGAAQTAQIAYEGIGVAQQVERRPPNPNVVGSSPAPLAFELNFASVVMQTRCSLIVGVLIVLAVYAPSLWHAFWTGGAF